MRVLFAKNGQKILMKRKFRTMYLIAFICTILFSVQVNAALNGGDKATGTYPEGLPKNMMVGLFEGNDSSWMKNSGVPWNSRYIYLTKGWTNNWGWGDRDGTYALDFMKSCAQMNAVPYIQYYCMNEMPGGGETQFYTKTKNAATMKEYFSDFILLMKKVKEFGKPVVILVEADGFGFMQKQTKSTSDYCAIKDTGLSELKSLPNSVAGWGMSFLEIRRKVGVKNALLGIHVSGWASGKDIVYFSTSDKLQPEVDKVYSFLSPMGLGSNQTGETYDLLVGDPLDRDPEFYRINNKQDRWLDTNDNASINSKSFNRYAEWLRLWNVKSKKRWILWQIPLGNSNHKNVNNNGGAREGYKGNFPEYFFGNGMSNHLTKYANSGVIALLFGAGTKGQSSYQNDIYTDGQPFMKKHAGDFLKSGGMTLGQNNTIPPQISMKIGDAYMLTNGKSVEIDPGRGTKPLLVNNRTMLPIRATIEALGGSLSWEDSSKKVSIQLNGKTINLWIGSSSIQVNGQNINTDCAPAIINGRTYVPLRAVLENLGYTVQWVESTKSILIRKL